MSAATLEDSHGRGRITFTRDGPHTVVELAFLAQWLPEGEVPESRLNLQFDSTEDPLASLHTQLLEHLRRPLVEISATPFAGTLTLHADAGDAALTLTFGETPAGVVQPSDPSHGFALVTVQSATRLIQISIATDVTTLDRFTAQLGDITN